MKKILFSIALAVLLSSCGGSDSSSVESSGMSEKDLIAGFEGVRTQFKTVFENPNEYDQAKLKPINDSLVFFVDALVADYPRSASLPEVLCRAGVTSLNVKNGTKALQYLNYVIDSFPDHQIVPQSMYFIGRTKEVLLEDLEGAKESYKALYRKYPNTVWGSNARASVELIMKPSILEESLMSDEVEDSTETK